MNAEAAAHRQVRLGLLVAGVPLTMGLLAFFAMPPLYSLWCALTGTGMKPNNAAAALAAEQPTGRFVEVFFESRVHDGLPVTLQSEHPSLVVEVGREARTTYWLENHGSETVHIRPIHLVSPISATPHFGMRLCFCFTDQTVAPGERLEFPVAFTFAPQLDPRTTTVSVCYALFRISPNTPRSEDQIRIQREIEKAGGVVSPGFRVMSEAEIARLRASERQEVKP